MFPVILIDTQLANVGGKLADDRRQSFDSLIQGFALLLDAVRLCLPHGMPLPSNLLDRLQLL
ncbi:hypothetical protein D3C80_1952600 [compost metagenome]